MINKTKNEEHSVLAAVDKRFREKVSFEEGEKGCWVWLGPLRGRNGGVFHGVYVEGEKARSICVRRYAFIRYGGNKILDKKYRLMNLCGNICCVKPSHYKVQFVTGKEEETRAVVKHNRDLVPEDIKKIRADNRSLNFLAKKYKLDVVLIKRLKNRAIVL